MPTYTTTIIPGFFIFEGPPPPEMDPEITDSGATQLTVTTTENFAISYEIVETFSDGIPRIEINEPIGQSLVVTLNNRDVDAFDNYIGTIFWGAGNETTLLTFEYEDPITFEYEVYVFVLAGTPITDILAVNDTITGFEPITSGPFAPGQVFELEDFFGATSSLVDSIDGTARADIIDGTDGNDIMNGLGGDDTLRGAGGDDVLEGRAGSDELRGGSGSDRIEGGSGADQVLGGGGTDLASYESSSSGVSVNLATGAASGGHANGDTLVSIEGLIGSRFADALTGDEGNNALIGGRGGDTLRGGLGDDIIEGGGGGDRVLGGSGIDTASYLTATSGVALNLTSGVGTAGNANGDEFASIENVLGSNFDDVIVGSARGNLLIGAGGDDELRGSAGNDDLEGGAGGDTLNGGSGVDTATYATALAGVTLNMATGGTGGDAAGDTFFRVENIVGSGFDDVIRGDGGANAINGGRGDDIIRGGSGDDAITGGRGNDTMYGGGGDDTFVFRANNGDDTIVALNAAADSIRFAINGLEYSDLVFSEEGGDAVIDYGSGSITLDGISEEIAVELAFDFG